MQEPNHKKENKQKNGQQNHNSKQNKNTQNSNPPKQDQKIENNILDIKSSDEVAKLKDLLARTQADFSNYRARIEKAEEEVKFFMKRDIYKNILPRIDDLERIITNTPEDKKQDGVFQGVYSVYNKLIGDLEKMGVKSFNSIGEEVNPDIHEVMTVLPGKEGIIIGEMEKGYMIGNKVLRVAKVIVGQG